MQSVFLKSAAKVYAHISAVWLCQVHKCRRSTVYGACWMPCGVSFERFVPISSLHLLRKCSGDSDEAVFMPNLPTSDQIALLYTMLPSSFSPT